MSDNEQSPLLIEIEIMPSLEEVESVLQKAIIDRLKEISNIDLGD